MNKYRKWIEEFVTEPYGNCKKFTECMKKEFPELTICKGFYYCPIWGRRQHYWLKTKNNEIVDPTDEQFPSKGGGEYEELSEEEITTRVPTGVCADCGNPVYGGNMFCSEKCEKSYLEYIKTGRL